MSTNKSKFTEYYIAVQYISNTSRPIQPNVGNFLAMEEVSEPPRAICNTDLIPCYIYPFKMQKVIWKVNLAEHGSPKTCRARFKEFKRRRFPGQPSTMVDSLGDVHVHLAHDYTKKSQDSTTIHLL